ncbi:MAG: response regulator transcription factor [Ignavibacteriales bacterium]|nr:MAG: response regulator transcription factor [Ignavibacteriales bacterium]
MINILIADDHAIVREGLKQIVAEEPDMKVTGEASNADEVISKMNDKVFDVVVLDINMPGKSGLDVLKDLRIQHPEIPVLILSMYAEEQYGIRALKAGASGYLKKVSAPDELVSAIRKIVAGGKYVSASLAENLAKSVDENYSKLPHENLSDREFEVMCRIASGETAENISDILSISIHTFYSYRNRILEKMKMKSNVELTQYVLNNKLIQ